MKIFLITIIALSFLSSCIETVAIGALSTAVVASREKSLKDTKDDTLIEAAIDLKFVNHGLKKPTDKIGVTVNEQRVLLTGIVDDQSISKIAEKLSWEVDGVKEVINEIQIIDKKSSGKNFLSYFPDTAITGQVKSKILFDKNVSYLNISVTTINRVVYLIGVAENQREIKKALELAAKTSGVKKVVSHLILKSDKRRKS